MLKATAIAASLLCATQASAEEPCGPYIAIAEDLALKYGETRHYIGLTNANVMVEVWINTDNGSFTVMQRNTSGVACIRATGDNWTSTTPQPKGEGL